MEGAVELAEEIFHMPVRVGAPQHAEGLSDIIRNPIYATAVGLLIFGARDEESATTSRSGSTASGFFAGIRDWFGKHF
jgi:cell division protein FtsA